MHGGFFLNRQAWKFQGWLQGYNGGPLRMPTQRIHDHQMGALRKGLIDAGSRPAWTRSVSSSPDATPADRTGRVTRGQVTFPATAPTGCG